jgi:GcrA cell cycle regulator
MTGWTDEKVETLKRLHFNDYSFSEIANVLGMTRNACIGKASRLGLSKPSAPVFRNKPEPSKAKTDPGMIDAIRECARAGMSQRQTQEEVARRFPNVVTPALSTINSMSSRLGIRFREHKPKAAPKHRQQPQPIERMFPAPQPAVERPGAVTIIDLEQGMCRWPIGYPQDFDNFRYCGAGTFQNRSYCRAHVRISCADYWLKDSKEGRALARELA